MPTNSRFASLYGGVGQGSGGQSGDSSPTLKKWAIGFGPRHEWDCRSCTRRVGEWPWAVNTPPPDLKQSWYQEFLGIGYSGVVYPSIATATSSLAASLRTHPSCYQVGDTQETQLEDMSPGGLQQLDEALQRHLEAAREALKLKQTAAAAAAAAKS